MNKKMSKRQKELKSKLMAAICMLLVSSIMMVSTTYAWFTLSTAPEVTGITTAVGANGNLEMALLNEKSVLAQLDDPEAVGGIKSAVGDSVAHTGDYKKSNITWGNLVDLSTGYGLDQITLYPAALNMATADQINVGAFLQSPVYGADGRVDKLEAVTGFGVYQDNAFVASEGFGVRAIGKAANMTPRESSFRMARININTFITSAKGNISTALNKHGAVLADPVLAEAMGSEAKYGQAQVDGLSGLVDGLEAALVNVEKAYLNAILAYAASSDGSEAAWQAVAAVVNAEGATLESVTEAIPDGMALPDGLSNYDHLVATVEGLRDAVDGLYETLEKSPNDMETQFTNVAKLLADPNAMKVGGYTKDEILADKEAKVSELLGLATSGKLVVTLAGDGAFAEFADHLGNYTASVVIMNGAMNTTMAVNTTKGYLPAIHAGLADKAPVTDTSNTVKTLSDFYGYVIDMAFRTNAADSDLMLQIDPTDRIYTDNPSETTMGGGSYMEFTSNSPTFSLEQMENLMESIKIIFFNPADGKIIANAKLDNAESNGNQIRAEIHMDGDATNTTAAGFVHHTGSRYYGTVTPGTPVVDETTKVETTEVIYVYTSKDGANQLKEVVTKTVTPESGEGDEKVPAKTTWGTSTYYKYENGAFATTALSDETTIAALKVVKHSDGEQIMKLNQNEAAAVSVLVYLDGESITNADVAFDSAKSMTGTMNLQFCSSANLQPMQYGGELELPAETTPPATTEPTGGNGGATGTAMTAVTAAADSVATIKSASFTGSTVTIELDGFDAATEEVTSITVAGTAITTVQPSDAGVLTFTSEGVAADTAVVVTIAAKASQG